MWRDVAGSHPRDDGQVLRLVEQSHAAADHQKSDGDKKEDEKLDPGRSQVAPVQDGTFPFPCKGKSEQERAHSRAEEGPIGRQPVPEQIREEGVDDQPQGEADHRTFALLEVKNVRGEQPSAGEPEQGSDKPGEDVERITRTKPVHFDLSGNFAKV